jgi:hypothetical protein
MLLATPFAPACARADVVTDWNRIAFKAADEAKWTGMGQSQRALAMMHAAMFDAVNAIQPRYEPYVFKAPASPAASPVAAASEAAFKVLTALTPEQSRTLEAANAAALASVADEAARAAGVSLGDASAQAMLMARQNDGADYSNDYSPSPPAPGVYQPTSKDSPIVGSHGDRVRPFALETSSQFLLPPPPPLNGSQFLRDLAEVREIGGATSQRSPEHTAIALFHAPYGYVTWNAIGREAIGAAQPDILDSARAMALLNFALSDALSASLQTKFLYNFWRPVTAIGAGGAGFGHPEIAPDPGWTPLLVTPMFPEYACMHCAVGAAASRVLTGVFGDRFSFAIGEAAKPRSYRSFQEFAEEEAQSRVIGGVHFHWSVVAGSALGESVARVVLTRLKPL